MGRLSRGHCRLHECLAGIRALGVARDYAANILVHIHERLEQADQVNQRRVGRVPVPKPAQIEEDIAELVHMANDRPRDESRAAFGRERWSRSKRVKDDSQRRQTTPRVGQQNNVRTTGLS